MKTFNARQLYKNEFVKRQNELDFTDDGTRFNMYSYKNTIPFHIARWNDMVFISVRVDYIQSLIPELEYIPYDVYSKWDVYKLFDQYNGVYKDGVDLDNFFNSLEEIYKTVANHYNYKY